MIKGDEFCPDLCATPAGSRRGRGLCVLQPLGPQASGVFLPEPQKQFAFCLALPFLCIRNCALLSFAKSKNLIILLSQSSLAVSLKKKKKNPISFYIPPFNTLSHCIVVHVTVVSLLSTVPSWMDLEVGFRFTSAHHTPQSKAVQNQP